MNDIYIHPKYTPLFDSDGTRYKIVTGGRNSGKSFAVSTGIIFKTYDDDKVILYTRYTLVNAETSIIPEFIDKIQRLNLENDFIQKGNDIINRKTGGRILFRGIKTSTGINTASLKSISNLKMWVNDESEELVDEGTFDTIDLSIREKDAKLEIWLILNPKDINHFIYRRFFQQNGVEQVCNMVKGDITYIHTTYLENKSLDGEYYFDVGFLDIADKCKEVDEQKYNNVFLGYWASLTEGRIYKGWNRIADTDYPADLPCWYGVDWGFSNDPAAVVRICFDASTYTVYLHQVLYEKGLLTAAIAQSIKDDMLNRKRTLYHTATIDAVTENGAILINGFGVDRLSSFDPKVLPREVFDEVSRELNNIYTYVGEVYCDPARPEQIREMKIIHGLMVSGAVNKDKTGRIEYLKYFNVCYTESSKDLHNEYVNYRWKQSKTDKTRYINEAEDGNDHLMDALNYGVATHLRRLGIANRIGEQ